MHLPSEQVPFYIWRLSFSSSFFFFTYLYVHTCKDLKTNITRGQQLIVHSLFRVQSLCSCRNKLGAMTWYQAGLLRMIHFHSHKHQTTNFWLFSILHPELKHIAEKTTFASHHICESPLKVPGIGRHFRGGVILRGAVLLPRRNHQAAPQAGGCSWHLLLGCQTAFFYRGYGRRTQKGGWDDKLPHKQQTKE